MDLNDWDYITIQKKRAQFDHFDKSAIKQIRKRRPLTYNDSE